MGRRVDESGCLVDSMEDAQRASEREELATAIWDTLCPGIRCVPEDRETYLAAADAALAVIYARCNNG